MRDQIHPLNPCFIPSTPGHGNKQLNPISYLLHANVLEFAFGYLQKARENLGYILVLPRYGQSGKTFFYQFYI